MNKKTRILCEDAILTALSCALSFVPIFKMPMGGSVTLLSMLPVMLASFRNGAPHGLICGLLFSLVQLAAGFFSGNVFVYCATWQATVTVILFDYIVPFTQLGLVSVFSRLISKKHFVVSSVTAMLIVMFIRFICHFITGVTVWKQYAGDYTPFVYSLLYNGSYMLIEGILTTAAAIPIINAPQIRKLLISKKK